MLDLKDFEVWFITGSQHLYGDATLKKVAEHSIEIAAYFDTSEVIPVKVIFKPVVKTPDEIWQTLRDANTAKNCVGVITWMHTFSPAKMWINGLKELQKPLLHLHTQFNSHIPFAEIDMDFMNLNQSAHGDREFAHLLTKMDIKRKTVVGHWQETDVLESINVWSRVAVATNAMQGMKVARFGDNMREVSVTDGDKVAAQMKFGFSVNTHPVGDLVEVINHVKEEEIDVLIETYQKEYTLMDSFNEKQESLREAARIELGIKTFLEAGDFGAYTNTFEDLHGMKQLPGIATQRLMAAGYGFGAEGDWKTAALLRTMKVMAS
ncbi:UNVERIFIED_CONTAM: hypothetical protein GTU68_026530, partial [Idotea baltica]|nr:hypothetical protein [Idotea baltica]